MVGAQVCVDQIHHTDADYEHFIYITEAFVVDIGASDVLLSVMGRS